MNKSISSAPIGVKFLIKLVKININSEISLHNCKVGDVFSAYRPIDFSKCKIGHMIVATQSDFIEIPLETDEFELI